MKCLLQASGRSLGDNSGPYKWFSCFLAGKTESFSKANCLIFMRRSYKYKCCTPGEHLFYNNNSLHVRLSRIFGNNGPVILCMALL